MRLEHITGSPQAPGALRCERVAVLVGCLFGLFPGFVAAGVLLSPAVQCQVIVCDMILRAGQSDAQCLPNFWKHLLMVYSPISGACEFVLLQNPWCKVCVMKPQCHPLTSALYRVHDKSLITTMPLAGRRHAYSLLSHLHEHYLASHATYDAKVTACTRVPVVGQALLPSTFECNSPAALTATHGASVMLRVCCGRSREDQL